MKAMRGAVTTVTAMPPEPAVRLVKLTRNWRRHRAVVLDTGTPRWETQ
jgi:hypothetical protein